MHTASAAAARRSRLARGLASWVAATNAARVAAARRAAASAHAAAVDDATTRGVLRAWRQVLWRSRVTAGVIAACRERQGRRVAALLFGAWVAYTRARRTDAAYGRHAAGLLAASRAGRAVAVWRHAVLTRRDRDARCTYVGALAAAHAVAGAWHAWRRHLAALRACRVLVANTTAANQRAALLAWRAGTEARSMARVAAARLLVAAATASKRAAWGQWERAAGYAAALSKASTVVTARVRARQLAGAVACWRTTTAGAVRQAHAVGALRASLARATVRTCLGGWAAVTLARQDRAARLAAAVRAARGRVMVAVVRNWAEVARDVRCERVGGAADRRRSCKVSIAAWRQALARSRFSSRVARARAARAGVAALAAWRNALLAGRVGRFAAARQRSQMAAAVTVWRARTAAAGALAAVEARVAAATRAAAARRAVVAWRTHTRQVATLAARAAAARAAALASVWAAWRGYVVVRRAKALRGHAARAAVLAGIVGRVFGGWVAVTRTAAAERAVLARDADLRRREDVWQRRSRATTTRGVWRAWGAVVAARRRRAAAAAALTLSVVGGRALTAWRAAAARARARSRATASCTSACRAAAVSRAWAAWRQALTTRRREAYLAAALAAAGAAVVRKRLATAFGALRAAAARGRAAAALASARRIRLAAAVLRAWRLTAAASATGRRRALAAAFGTWRTAVAVRVAARKARLGAAFSAMAVRVVARTRATALARIKRVLQQRVRLAGLRTLLTRAAQRDAVAVWQRVTREAVRGRQGEALAVAFRRATLMRPVFLGLRSLAVGRQAGSRYRPTPATSPVGRPSPPPAVAFLARATPPPVPAAARRPTPRLADSAAASAAASGTLLVPVLPPLPAVGGGGGGGGALDSTPAVAAAAGLPLGGGRWRAHMATPTPTPVAAHMKALVRSLGSVTTGDHHHRPPAPAPPAPTHLAWDTPGGGGGGGGGAPRTPGHVLASLALADAQVAAARLAALTRGAR